MPDLNPFCQSSLFPLPFFATETGKQKMCLEQSKGAKLWHTFVGPLVLFHSDKSKAYKVELEVQIRQPSKDNN